MIYQILSVSKLWPERVRVGTVIVHDDLAAIAQFNRLWADSPDLIRAELRRESGLVIAGGGRNGWTGISVSLLPKPAAPPAPARPRSKPSRAVRRRYENASR